MKFICTFFYCLNEESKKHVFCDNQKKRDEEIDIVTLMHQ